MAKRRIGGVLFGAALLIAACGSEKAGNVADSVAEKAVAERAAGRWRCETDQVESGSPKHLTTVVAIAEDGRFSYEVVDLGGPGPLAGTWRIEDLQLSLQVPWQSDGRNGFNNWMHVADADPPTHIDGQSAAGAVQDLDIDVSDDRVTIHQDDDGEIGGVGYAWDVVCDKTSDDPGDIPPTIPTTPSGD